MIYLVEDDEAVRDSIDIYLSVKGLTVAAFASGLHLLAGKFDDSRLFILDINLPDIDGFALLEALRDRGCLSPVIFISGLGSPETRSRATRAGAAAFLDKPIDAQNLYAEITRIIGSGFQTGQHE